MSSGERYCAGCQREMEECTCMQQYEHSESGRTHQLFASSEPAVLGDVLKEILPDAASVKKLLRQIFEKPVFAEGKQIYPNASSSWQIQVNNVWSWLDDRQWMNAEIRNAFYFALATFSFKEQTELELIRRIESLKKDLAKMRIKVQHQRTELSRMRYARKLDGEFYEDRKHHYRKQIDKLKADAVDDAHTLMVQEAAWATEKKGLEARLAEATAKLNELGYVWEKD